MKKLIKKQKKKLLNQKIINKLKKKQSNKTQKTNNSNHSNNHNCNNQTQKTMMKNINIPKIQHKMKKKN